MKTLKATIAVLTLAFIIVLGLFFNVASGQVDITNLTGEDYIEDLADQVLQEYGINDIHLIIYPARYLPQYKGNPSETGFSDVEETGPSRPNLYRIFIDIERTSKPIKKTLFHELIHIIQHYEGRLDRSGKYPIYNGEEYTIDRPYRLLPWEIEARNEARRFEKMFM